MEDDADGERKVRREVRDNPAQGLHAARRRADADHPLRRRSGESLVVDHAREATPSPGHRHLGSARRDGQPEDQAEASLSDPSALTLPMVVGAVNCGDEVPALGHRLLPVGRVRTSGSADLSPAVSRPPAGEATETRAPVLVPM
jgi:hypothetical protein